jgi:hypothetical protein
MVDAPPIGLVLFLENKSGEIGTSVFILAGTVKVAPTYGSQKKTASKAAFRTSLARVAQGAKGNLAGAARPPIGATAA